MSAVAKPGKLTVQPAPVRSKLPVVVAAVPVITSAQVAESSNASSVELEAFYGVERAMVLDELPATVVGDGADCSVISVKVNKTFFADGC